MAFNPLKLSLMVGADGASWYRYVSAADALAAISAANYFGPVANILNPGDMIVVNDSANLNQILFVKTSNPATNAVTTAAGFATPADMIVNEAPAEPGDPNAPADSKPAPIPPPPSQRLGGHAPAHDPGHGGTHGGGTRK